MYRDNINTFLYIYNYILQGKHFSSSYLNHLSLSLQFSLLLKTLDGLC